MHRAQTNFDTIALDVGKKRVGVALGNSQTQWVETLTTYPRGQKKAEQMVLELIDRYNIETVVVGLPLDDNSGQTTESENIKQFANRLRKRKAVKIEYIDEWGSSIAAKRRLNISAQPPKEVRNSGVIDAVSASIILESFFGQS